MVGMVRSVSGLRLRYGDHGARDVGADLAAHHPRRAGSGRVVRGRREFTVLFLYEAKSLTYPDRDMPPRSKGYYLYGKKKAKEGTRRRRRGRRWRGGGRGR